MAKDDTPARDRVDVPVDTPADLEQIYTWLRDAILTGELAPAEQVSQVMLAKSLGVSRIPLREALRMLQREGLIEAQRNQRVQITGISFKDLEELYAMRIVLESFSVRVSVPLMDSQDLSVLESALCEMEAVENAMGVYSEWDIPHRRFHQALVSHAGKRFRQTLSDLFDHAERYRRLLSHAPDATVRSGREHREIYDAVCAGETELTASLLARHLSRTALTLLATFAPEHDPVAVRAALRMASEARQT